MTIIKKLIPDYIFEASWEVCNKVGGIYTVLSTRAHVLQTQFEDKIIFIGPDLWKGKNHPDFIESPSLFNAWKEYAGSKENLHVRIGRWNVPGNPIVVLVDFQVCFEQKNDLYASMWQQFGVDSLHAYGDYDESCIFAYATGLVIESFYTYFDLRKKKVVAHFNEWMLGMGALYIRSSVPSIATLFTTHATSIGRSIAGNGKPLYAYLNAYNGDQMAQELNMEAKHSVEKQAAWHVDCFTTVSDITARECEQLLDKKPDIVTPNGFEAGFIPTKRAYTVKREKAREKLIEVAGKLTGKTIRKDAFLLSTSGRYEYKNKGIDVFIAAIDKLRQYTFGKDIIAFILVPGWIKGARKDLHDRLTDTECSDKSLPNPYITHELYEPFSDKVSAYLNHLQFINSKDQEVSLIFVPSYLTGDDGIFNLPYYDLLAGMDLTVYPSYYEPWGYTPLESIAFSIPTITTNLAGFGLWAKQEKEAGEGINSGVEVIERTDDNYLEVTEKTASVIASYIRQSSTAINRSRKAASERSEHALWNHFISYYLEAYHIALQQAKGRKK
ncbi:MAG: glycogen/starch synthase [Dysgonamonadaceae bacterium]|jgi:glycogen synthase|nr:glycogen/starch synthase [Dysgonamonadaceae bacterium]